MLPDADADVVIDVLQAVDAGRIEAPAEIASRGGIGNALGAQGVEIVDIIASQFDVLQTLATAQRVKGEVENMIGFRIRETDFENTQALIDGFDQTDVLRELMKESDTAMAKAMHTLGNLIAEIAAPQYGAKTLWEFGLVQTAFNFPLAGPQLLA